MRRPLGKLLLLLPIPVLVLAYMVFTSQTPSMPAALKACQETAGQDHIKCESQVLSAATKTQQPTAVMRQLIDLASKDSSIAADCHQLGHNFGVWAYEEFRQAAVAPDLGECSYAYYHGLLKGAARVTALDKLAATESELCRQFTPRQDILCAHGIGHALGDRYDDLQTLIKICSDITIENQMKECFTGATMTWGVSNPSVDPAVAVMGCTKATDSLDLVNICIDGVLVYSQLGEANNQRLMAFCPTLNLENQPSCYSALGGAAINPGDAGVTLKPRDAIAVYDRTCGKLSEGYPYSRCGMAFASAYLVNTQDLAAGRELCSTVRRHRAACEEGMEYGRRQFVALPVPRS